MEKSNKICLIIIIVCAVLVVGLCAYAIYNHSTEEITDAIKFKEEYEVLNGVESPNSEYTYTSLSIDSNNPFVYKTGKEILEVLKNEEAIVYFGFSSCPWCRNIVEELTKVAKDNNLKTIYYVDIRDIRDTYVFSGSIIPEQTKKGTDAYYEILDFLGDNLEKYFINDESGNRYDTGVTRLYAPTVVAVKDGEVTFLHEGTVESQENPYEKLTDDQQKELNDIFTELVKSINTDGEICSDDAC